MKIKVMMPYQLKMESKNFNKKKNLFFAFLFVFSFLFLFSSGVLASNSAVFTTTYLPQNYNEIMMESNQIYNIDLNSYTANAQPSSTQVQFWNPDTSAYNTLLNGGSITTSYFKISLSNNQVQLQSYSKAGLFSGSHGITFSICSIPDSSCSPTVTRTVPLFLTNLASIPQTIDTLPTENVTNGPVTLDLNNYFQYMNKFYFSFTDPVLGGSQGYYYIADAISGVTTSKTPTCSLTNGGIYICVGQNQTLGATDFIMSIQSTNNNFNQNVTLKAYDSYTGNYVSQLINVKSNSISGGGGGGGGTIPYRLPASYPSNISLLYNSSSSPFYIGNYWGNYTFIKLEVYNSTLGAYQNISYTKGSAYTTTFKEFSISVGSSTSMPITFTSKTSNYQQNIYLDICNSYGCNLKDSFGQRNLLNLYIHENPPLQVGSIGTISMKYSQQSTYSFANIFENFNFLKINFTTNDTNITSLYNSSLGTVSFNNAYFSGTLTTQAIIINSKNTSLSNFPIQIAACNNAGCVNTDLSGIPDNLFLTISSSGISGGTAQYNDFVSGFLGIFPDSSTLTFSQKAAFVALSIIIVTFLLLIVGAFVTHDVGGPLLFFTGFVDVMLIIFFTSIGYISAYIIVFLILIAMAITWFRVRGG